MASDWYICQWWSIEHSLANKRVLSFTVYKSGCSIEFFCSKVILGQVWSMVNDALLPNLFSISFSVTMGRKFVKFGWIKCRSISLKSSTMGRFLKNTKLSFSREIKHFNEGDLFWWNHFCSGTVCTFCWNCTVNDIGLVYLPEMISRTFTGR